ncbi:serine hydrolase domain-containing protein [Solirubrobacter soli]|uniref:serine hydrolase domain-containing protein n=1 Tax=Solirubrobacter soli TaxID=363832 RepID=UPI0004006AE3|nr:serine hydrolase domain-containing protein [Solirubrobacter soli]
MKTLLLALVATLALTAPASASLKTDVNRLVDSGVPGTIVLSRDSAHTTRLAVGVGDLKTHARLEASDRFRVGSVTKAFTATIVLQLAGEQRLGLDDTVEQHLPGVVPNGSQITIRQLLNMTSGLADYLGDDDTVANSAGTDRRFTPQELVGFATAHPVHSAPGAEWRYCNTCYVLLGMIAERVDGRPIATQMRERIFTPAHLRHTTFESGSRIAGRHAHGYENGPADVTALNQTWSWTAGAIVSTVDDVARFYRALLGGKLLAPAQKRELLTPPAALQLPFGPGVMTGYTTGVFRMQLPCGEVWGHDGGTPGYRTFTLHSADARKQVVVMTNLGEDSLTPRQASAYYRVVRTAYCG